MWTLIKVVVSTNYDLLLVICSRYVVLQLVGDWSYKMQLHFRPHRLSIGQWYRGSDEDILMSSSILCDAIKGADVSLLKVHPNKNFTDMLMA